MNTDLPEGEPRRAEHLARRGRARSGWTRRADRPHRPRFTRHTLLSPFPLLALGTLLAYLAISTGWSWLTLPALAAVFAGIAIDSRLARRPRRARRTDLSWLTLRSWWARWSWRALLAVEARLTGRPRRARWTWWTDDALARPRRSLDGEGVDDGTGEGQPRQ